MALSPVFSFEPSAQLPDGQPIIDKPPLYECTIIDMIEQDFLCDVRAIAIRTDTDLDSIHTKMGDYSEKELDLAVNTPERNRRVVEAYQEHADGRIAICFAVTVDHAQALADTFNEQGIPAGTVSGETPLDERKHLYKALRTGEIRVLTNVQVLTEGFDEPLVDCVIMARPTQSRSLYVQSIGRGLRLAPAKQDCLILDLTDNCLKHRLQPQNLNKALGTSLRDGMSVKEKAQKEAEEREEREHKLKTHRKEDVQIDLLDKLEWQRRDNGLYVLEVGQEKHRIGLVPSSTRDGYYRVAARLAPDFQIQYWTDAIPLGWAQQLAETRAWMLKDPNRVVLVDKNAPWRKKPLDMQSQQAAMLRKHRLPIKPGMTKGEAADLLAKKLAEINYLRQMAQPPLPAPVQAPVQDDCDGMSTSDECASCGLFINDDEGIGHYDADGQYHCSAHIPDEAYGDPDYPEPPEDEEVQSVGHLQALPTP